MTHFQKPCTAKAKKEYKNQCNIRHTLSTVKHRNTIRHCLSKIIKQIVTNDKLSNCTNYKHCHKRSK